MDIIIIKEPITRAELRKIAEKRYGDLVKAAVDIKQSIMAVGGELHIDEEMVLIEQVGSVQNDVWGINIYPEEVGENFIEFDSMINLKPSLGNRTRSVDDPQRRDAIIAVVHKLIQ